MPARFLTRIKTFQQESKMKRFVMTLAAGAVGLTIGVGMSIPSAHAAGKSKIDCGAVMKEVNGGKKAKEIAKDMNISTSSVYKCKKREMASAKAASKAGNETAAKPAAPPASAPKP
jgi:Mor family transcriptional regulator